MKMTYQSIASTGVLLIASTLAQANGVSTLNLSNSPARCVEEAVPSFPSDGLVSDEYGNHEDIKDLLERTSGVLNEKDKEFETDWLLMNAATDAKSKISIIYESANKYNMPPQVLTGALIQESSMADLSISEDFGNWSCGIGQLNVQEWCEWANQESTAVKSRIQWPSKEIAKYVYNNPQIDVCSGYFIRAEHVKPFYSQGMQRLRAENPKRAEFLLSQKLITEPNTISYQDATPMMKWVSSEQFHCKRRNRFNDECLKISPSKSSEEAAAYLRYLISKNFAENCSNHEFGIPAKAFSLKLIFDALPDSIKDSQRYTGTASYQRKCMQTPKSRYFPMHVGWLLADAVYNAGEEILPGIYKYWKKKKLSPEQVGPIQLVDSINFTLNEKKIAKHLTPIAKCEARFHIRNVIRHITLPGQVLIPDDPNESDDCTQPTAKPAKPATDAPTDSSADQ